MEDFFRFYGLLNAMNEQVKRYFQKFLPASAFAFSALLADSKVYWTSPIGHFDFVPFSRRAQRSHKPLPGHQVCRPPSQPSPRCCDCQTFHHQPGHRLHHGHLVPGHARVVPRHPRRQGGDGQHRGHVVDPRDPDGVRGLQSLAVPEPGDEHGGVAGRDEAGLSDAVALGKVRAEGEGFNLWCD